MEHDFHESAFHHLKEEIEDACEYLKKADEAEEEGKHYFAHGLKRIAWDEYSHAKFLRDYLMTKEAYNNHEEIDEHWHKLRHKLGLEA